MDIRRGDIFYVYRNAKRETGSEMEAGRPGIVVSNNGNNANSNVLQMVYCTTQEKPNLPTHCKVSSTNRTSTVLCEQIHSVDVMRLGDYVGQCSQNEMDMIDKCLAVSLALNPVSTCDSASENNEALINERDTYKFMYEQLLERVIGKR